MAKSKMKPLSAMRNKSKGPLHHMEIHPAKTTGGGTAFTTKVFRGRTPQQTADAMAPGKPYTPEVSEDKDSEVVHPDGVDMVDHVKGSFGVKDDPDDEEEE